MKKVIFIFIFAVLSVGVSFAKGIKLPADMPTYEALINLHKILAQNEEASMKQVGASKIVQDSVTGKTNKFYQVRDILNSKLDTGLQWVSLAASISNLTLSSAKLAKEYADFTKFFYKNLADKPFMTLEYANLNYNIVLKTGQIKKDLATLAAMKSGVFKASIKENMELIFYIQEQINEMRMLVNSSYNWIWLQSESAYHIDYIWEILNDKLLNDIAKRLVLDWNRNAAMYSSENV